MFRFKGQRVLVLCGLSLIDGWDGALRRTSMGISLMWVNVMAVRLWCLS